jgi:hypothetical protein
LRKHVNGVCDRAEILQEKMVRLAELATVVAKKRKANKKAA